MDFTKKLRSLHLVSTVWFMLCTGYVFIIAMRQTGFNWLVIFSLSGHLTLLVILLVCVYLFAIFRSIDKVPDMQKEHPLTSTPYYMTFYVSMPLLGAIAGLLGIIGEAPLSSFVPAAAMGTIGATFLTWVIIDCIAGSVELLLPQPRKNRSLRLADIKQKKRQEQAQQEQSLNEIFEREYKNKLLWESEFASKAERLADLLASDCNDWISYQQQAIDIGVDAWRTGGLICMKQLQNMAEGAFRKRYAGRQFTDYISAWWDGIGNWRIPSAG
jgi:gas vesicle protein